MVRFRAWPRLSAFVVVTFVAFAILALAAAIGGAWFAAGALGLIAALTAMRTIWEAGLAMGAARTAIAGYREALQ